MTLSKTAWLDHGLEALATLGPSALRANPLAKSLGVSRGSFYWHFSDLAAFHAALLVRWQNVSTNQVVASLDAKASPGERLQALMHRAVEGNDGLERALRAWAVQNELAAATIREVDAARVAYIGSLLEASGVPCEHSSARAAFLYWANIGRIMMGVPASSMDRSALDAIASLFAT